MRFINYKFKAISNRCGYLFSEILLNLNHETNICNHIGIIYK